MVNVKPVKLGNTERMSFGKIDEVIDMPNLIDIQKASYKWLLDEGLKEVFKDVSGITDYQDNLVLDFIDYTLDVDHPNYSVIECKVRDATYSAALRVTARLLNKSTGEIKESNVFMGDFPLMTASGTFVINGAERVVVSQLHRSPGVFFGQGVHANGTVLYSARIIPFKGSWIEFATDINNVMYAYIDRKKKLPVTTLLRAMGFEQDKDILQIFDLAEEVKVNKKNMKAAIGRKLAARVLKTWNEDFVDEDTGEVVSIERNEMIMERETVLTEENIDDILESGSASILLHKDAEAATRYSIIFNTLAKDPSNSEKEAVLYIYRQLRNADPADDASAREVFQNIFFSDKRYDLGEVGPVSYTHLTLPTILRV